MAGSTRTLARLFEVLKQLLGGRHELFVSITFVAGRHDIALRAFAAASNRNNMIHGELGGGEFLPAIMTEAAGKLVPPPLRLAELLGSFPFFPDPFGVGVGRV
jgi:hypothetical protein